MPDKPRILLTRRFPDAVEQRARRDFLVEANPSDAIYSAHELLERAVGCDGILLTATERLDRSLVDRLPDSVRIAATFSVGYDHIDLEAAKSRGLVITNTPGILTDATADVAFLLLLAAARRAGEGERLVRADQWKYWSPIQLLGTDITGKRLGIVGMGRIGQAVARRARGFDMEVHYHNRRRLDPSIEAGAIFHSSLESLLAKAQFLSLHCPATPETHHLINQQTIALLPRGAIVVNTARGSIVNDGALIAALRSGQLAAAGLDVFENEPAIHPAYRTLDNVFLLPHLGSASVETRDAMGFCALDNLTTFFQGQKPPNQIS